MRNYSAIFIIATAVFTAVESWGINHAGLPGTNAKCERLSVSMCRGLGYNLTAMPNFMGHEDQLLAERGVVAILGVVGACRGQQLCDLSTDDLKDLEGTILRITLPNTKTHTVRVFTVEGECYNKKLIQFMPLVHYNCSRHLRFFLCSVFAPVCSEHVAMQIPACKPLCLSVRRDCEPALSSLSLPWPNLLDCERFPDGKAVTLCVQPADEILPDQIPPMVPSLQPSLQPQWPVVQQVQTVQPITPGRTDRHHQCPPHFVQTPDVDTVTCTPRCGSDAYYRSDDKKFAERWMIGWAWLCFLSTLFTLLTFRVEPSRFRYPERPIVFLALCYNLLSVAYTIRGAVGAENLSCASQYDGPSYVPVNDGLRSIPCTVWWLARHYLGLASSAWWAVLCGCWLLSARNEWSSEALHNIAPYLHATAWGLPGLLTGGSLLSRSVAADELTGLCQVSDESAPWLEVLPHAVLLLLGCIFASIAGMALVRVRRVVRLAGRSATKLERLMTRLGIFALLYALPALGGLACVLHESWVRPRWRTLALLAALDCRAAKNCSPGPVYRAAGLEVVLLRLFLSLVVGVTSGMWVWSGKTCRAWSRLLAAPSKPLRPQQVMQPLGQNMFQGYKPDSGNIA